MKLFLITSLLVLSSLCQAEDVLNCGANYASGLGHLFKGEARQIEKKNLSQLANQQVTSFTLYLYLQRVLKV